jgi:hypothetical protein
MPSLYGFADQTDTTKLLNRLKRLDSNVQRTRGGTLQPTSSGRITVPEGLFTTAGQFNMSSTHISTVGNLSPTYNNMGFGISATETTAAIYWDGINASSQIIVLHRADGTRQSIPPGQLTVTGLTGGTTYYALPFWTDSSQCTVGWVPGTVGTPQIFFTSITDLTNAWQQNQIGREPLTTSYLTFKTNTVGSGSTPYNPPITDPHSNPLGCVMLGTEIEAVDNEEYETVHYPEHTWICIRTKDSRWVNVTNNHRFYDPEGYPREAQEFEKGDYIVHRKGTLEVETADTFLRTCTKVQVKMNKIHLFWANGFLSHNLKMLPP